MEKVVCNVHRFAYAKEKGCPFCEKERLERMYKRNTPKEVVSNAITEDTLSKLREHFNGK